jgi:hypothetical protein
MKSAHLRYGLLSTTRDVGYRMIVLEMSNREQHFRKLLVNRCVTVLFAVALYAAGAGAQSSRPIVRMKTFTASEMTCVIVHSDGDYRLERYSLPGAKPDIFETYLSHRDLEPLFAILNADDFRSLHSPSEWRHGRVSGTIYDFAVTRYPFRLQTYTTPDTTEEPPEPVKPLVDWVNAMNVRTRPVKNASAQCGRIKVKVK